MAKEKVKGVKMSPAKEKKKDAKMQKSSSESWDVLSFPYTTEKSMGLIERENTLVFIVDKRANKNRIKDSVEKAFGVKVDSVKTAITQKNFKKAYVRLNKANLASEVAIRMGII